MKRGTSILTVLAVAALVLPLAGCRFTRGNVVTATTLNSDTSTFNKLLKDAQLDKSYSKGGPYTVFAPSNRAFDQLPAGTLQDLQKPENREQLVAILTYHIVPGQYYTRDFMSNTQLKTENGATIQIDNVHSQWMYGDARITNPDVRTMNGVYMIIDKVQLPPQGAQSGAQRQTGTPATRPADRSRFNNNMD